MTVKELIAKLGEFLEDSEVSVEYPYTGSHSLLEYSTDGNIVDFENLDAAKYLIVKVK